MNINDLLAEREGFEPSIEFPLYTLSKRAPSTARPSLRIAKWRVDSSARVVRNQNIMRGRCVFGRRSRIEPVASFPVSRRALLLAPLAAAGCGRRKARAFPGYCFVANRQSQSVAAVDLTHFRVRRQIRLDGEPSAVLAHPAAPRVLVMVPETGTVYEIDAGTLAIARRARAGNRAVAMQLAPGNNALWVLYADPASLVEFPLESLRPGRRVRLGAPPDSFDLSTQRAAIASCQDGSIMLASLVRATVERTMHVGAEPSLVRFRSDGRQVITGSRVERLLNIFSAEDGKVVVRLPLPLEPRHFCFNADYGQLFVSGDGMDGIAIIFPYSTEVDQTILAGHAPGVMEVTNRYSSRAPAYLMVANPKSSNVTVIDIESRKLVAIVEVGQEPGNITMTPNEEYALVLNEKSGDLAVIRILSLATTPDGSHRRYKSAPLFTLIPVGERPVSAAVVEVG
jgi:YVTN family beta-propeller protein